MDQDIRTQMEALLTKSGLPFEEINVFGALRINVHITCISADTANKWASLLARALKGARIHVGEHLWNAAHNKGTCLKPTMRRGYLVAATV